MPDQDRSNTRIVVSGASGRIGRLLCAAVRCDPQLELVAALCDPNADELGAHVFVDDTCAQSLVFAQKTGVSADVVIDFSSDAGARNAIDVARATGAALLVGTTALSEQTRAALRDEASQRAVLVAPNTSLGVTVLAKIVEEISAVLGADYDCAIIDTHHSHKKDAPSGTALRLADAARAGGAHLPDDQIVAMRIGDVVGEHTVRFAGEGELLEFTHRATSRGLFVRGAIRAAKWLAGRDPGFWSMRDCIEKPAR